MKAVKSLLLVCLSFLAFANIVYAENTAVCFATSTPVSDPSMEILPRREIYLTKYQSGKYAMMPVTSGRIGEKISCAFSGNHGRGLMLTCGDEFITMDFANMRGSIQKASTASTRYGEQVMICRHMSEIIGAR